VFGEKEELKRLHEAISHLARAVLELAREQRILISMLKPKKTYPQPVSLKVEIK
jgi:hypothetical protein